VTHFEFIQQWETREKMSVTAGPPHDQHTFDEYLRWLHRSTRTHIKPPYTDHAVGDDSEDGVITDVYDEATREETQPQRAPLQRYVVRCSNGRVWPPFRIH
jgi:hypothetical protein